MKAWVRELQQARSGGEELEECGLVEPGRAEEVDRVGRVFDVKIPPGYMAAIERRGPDDPIWRTVVPTAEELDVRAEELIDPIGDEEHTPVRGVTHRYPDRVLLKPTYTCAVYCRFCFLRYAVGHPEETLRRPELDAALDYVASTPEVWEVILTGGDPLVLSDRRLQELLDRLRAIDHVRVIRVHTRVPAVLPSRVTGELVEILAGSGSPGKPVWVVTHINHRQEITREVEEACARLADRGIPLLNQCVLLRGVNDDPEALEALFRRLVELRIKPYYLHHGDLARGTSHFRTTLDQGQELMRLLRGRVSGLCQPTYVLDIPGGHGKVPVGPAYVERENGRTRVSDPWGEVHDYPPRADADADCGARP